MIIPSQKIYGLYARKHHIVEMRGDVTVSLSRCFCPKSLRTPFSSEINEALSPFLGVYSLSDRSVHRLGILNKKQEWSLAKTYCVILEGRDHSATAKCTKYRYFLDPEFNCLDTSIKNIDYFPTVLSGPPYCCAHVQGKDE